MSLDVDSLVLGRTSDPETPAAGETWVTGDRLKYRRSTGTRVVEDIKNKFDATAPPTATDDSSAGYEVGSKWVDVTNKRAYFCVDATATSAVWTDTTETENAAYGELYEHNDVGTEYVISPADDFVKWTSSTAGNVSTSDKMQANTTNDRLIVGSNGGGPMTVAISAALSTSNAGTISMCLYKNGVDAGGGLHTFDDKGNADLDLTITGIVDTVPGDYFEVYLTSSSNGATLTIYRLNFSMADIGANGTPGATGPQGPTGSGSDITLKDEGTSVTNTPHDTMNFVGDGVTVSDNGDGSANVTILGGAQSVIDIPVRQGDSPFFGSKSATYVVAEDFLFRGTSSMGTPTAIKVGARSDGGTAYIRVYDATNANIICEATTTSPTQVILSLGTLSSLPTGEAIWELQIRRDGGAANNVQYLHWGQIQF